MTDLMPGVDDPVILRGQALSWGLSDRAIRGLIHSGQWHRLRAGAYVDGELWRTSSPVARHRLTARAAYRQARTPVVLSHSSAVALHDGPTWQVPLDEVQLTRRDGRTGRAERGVRQHRGILLPDDITIVDGLDVTSATRTVLDLTTMVGTEAGLVVTNHFLNHRLTTIVDLKMRYRGMEQNPFTLRTGIVLRLADDRIESVGETRSFFMCWRAGLPAPIPQWQVHDDTGTLVARLDLAWPKHGVWLEFDGRTKYLQHRREGESVSDCVLREKAREDRIRELTGWVCIRITWDDLAHPARTVARIERMLRAFSPAS